MYFNSYKCNITTNNKKAEWLMAQLMKLCQQYLSSLLDVSVLVAENRYFGKMKYSRLGQV